MSLIEIKEDGGYKEYHLDFKYSDIKSNGEGLKRIVSALYNKDIIRYDLYVNNDTALLIFEPPPYSARNIKGYPQGTILYILDTSPWYNIYKQAYEHFYKQADSYSLKIMDHIFDCFRDQLSNNSK